ncbi:MAG: class 1 isoprenoid biosynthesis enzyme, partial [Gemmatimonadetes bacterium]|nr:class 1 isoprenoid biosynthesis enzyme [Gemmatimonadota bacterium]
FLSRAWAEASESTFRDLQGRDIDEAEFMAVCSRKMSASRIPVFAACRRAGIRADPWLSFLDALGVFEQFLDDLFDWHLDLRTGRASYLLSVARRAAGSAEGVVPWVLSEGIPWGRARLERYFAVTRERAAVLNSDPLLHHLDFRRTALDDTLAELERGSRTLSTLREAFPEEIV